MIIIRIVAVFLLITVFVLLGAYVVTRDKKYLTALKHLLTYTAWLAVVAVIFGFISRVIRF